MLEGDGELDGDGEAEGDGLGLLLCPVPGWGRPGTGVAGCAGCGVPMIAADDGLTRM